MAKLSTSDRVELFMFLLIRDHLPIGKVSGLIREVNEACAGGAEFAPETKMLCDISEKLAKDLLGG